MREKIEYICETLYSRPDSSANVYSCTLVTRVATGAAVYTARNLCSSASVISFVFRLGKTYAITHSSTSRAKQAGLEKIFTAAGYKEILGHTLCDGSLQQAFADS